MTIDQTTPVGEIAAAEPAATRSFHRFGIDFCCGGGLPLKDACEKKNVDVDAVLEDIRRETSGNAPADVQWNERPLVDLIAHILSTYHVPLKEELPRLSAMLDKVVRVHGHYDPERLAELQQTFKMLNDELTGHMAKEEQILFPMIMAGRGADAGAPISVMEHEHENAGAALERIRTLTDDYTPPEFACNTWRATWDGLRQLEEALHLHIHLENNILFPRAMASQIA